MLHIPNLPTVAKNFNAARCEAVVSGSDDLCRDIAPIGAVFIEISHSVDA